MPNKYNVPDEIVSICQTKMMNLSNLQKWEYERVRVNMLESIEDKNINLHIDSEYERLLSIVVLLDLMDDLPTLDNKYVTATLRNSSSYDDLEKLLMINRDFIG